MLLMVVFVGKANEGTKSSGRLVPYLEIQWPGHAALSPGKYHPDLLLNFDFYCTELQ